MIIKKRKDLPPKKYGKYFLSFEAPGDEDEEGASPIETSEVSPMDDDEDTDFTSIGLDDDEVVMDPDAVDDDVDFDDTDFTALNDEEEEDDTGSTIYQAPEEDPPADPPEVPDNDEEVPVEEPQEEQPPATDETTPSDNIDNAEADDAPGDVGDEQDPGTEEPAEDTPAEDTPAEEPAPEDAPEDEAEPEEDTDFSDIGNDEGDAVSDADANAAAGEEGEKKGPGLEYDSTRKYRLFQAFISLYNAINNYISKLENNVKDDITMNRAIKEATNRLREIRELCYDYMIIKFEISTYTQSLMFYQTLVVAIQTVFRMLSDLHNLDGKQKKNQDKS